MAIRIPCQSRLAVHRKGLICFANVHRKGLVCIIFRLGRKIIKVRLRRAVAGGAHPRRNLFFESLSARSAK